MSAQSLSAGWLEMAAGKPVKLSAHASERAGHRGAAEEEVAAAIREGAWQPAERGRLEAAKTFRHDADWNGKWYATKRVRAAFVESEGEIIVVTVYVY